MVDVTNFTMAETPMMTLVKRSIFFGLCAIIAGHIASYIVKAYANISLPDMVMSFNMKYLMEITLFVTGFVLFFGVHYFGIKY
jgi:hypothetical protein